LWTELKTRVEAELKTSLGYCEWPYGPNVRQETLIRATVAQLQKRSGITTFQWVKGHSGIDGNESANKLVGEGAQYPDTDHTSLDLLNNFDLQGINLAVATQAMLYRGVRWTRGETVRRSTATNLCCTRKTAFELWGAKPTDKRIWLSITANKNVSRNVKAFLWRCMHNANKCGLYWEKIENYEDRSQCTPCGELESMDHILIRCEDSPCHIVWEEVKKLCRWKGIACPTSFDIFSILACGFVDVKDKNGKRRDGANRLFQILVTKAAFLIWKLCCKRVLDHEEGEPEKPVTAAEATNSLAYILNTCLMSDRLMTNAHKYKSKTIPTTLVYRTWNSVLRDEENLPPDWIWSQSRVLVGITPPRPNGQNR
jgi:ribonuclease HI